MRILMREPYICTRYSVHLFGHSNTFCTQHLVHIFGQYVRNRLLSRQEDVMNVNGATSTWGSEAASGSKGMHGPRQLPDEAIDALANKLGMSSDDLKTKLQSSDDPRKVLDSLAQEKGISTDELRETVRSAMGSEDWPGCRGRRTPAASRWRLRRVVVRRRDWPEVAEHAGQQARDDRRRPEVQARQRGRSQEAVGREGRLPDDVRSAFQDAFKSWQSYGFDRQHVEPYSPEFRLSTRACSADKCRWLGSPGKAQHARKQTSFRAVYGGWACLPNLRRFSSRSHRRFIRLTEDETWPRRHRGRQLCLWSDDATCRVRLLWPGDPCLDWATAPARRHRGDHLDRGGTSRPGRSRRRRLGRPRSVPTPTSSGYALRPARLSRLPTAPAARPWAMRAQGYRSSRASPARWRRPALTRATATSRSRSRPSSHASATTC